jgi:hypothetical protein
VARQKSNRGRKTLQRKELMTAEKMTIVQLKDMGYTHGQVAKEVGCCEQTVVYTLKNWVPKHPEEVRVARANAVLAYAQKFRGKALEAMENVTKDSMTHDRIEVRDADGNITEVKHSGPTGMQIMTVAGIAIDKALKLDEVAQNILNESELDTTDSAESVAALVANIAKLSGKLKIEVDLTAIEDNSSVEADYEDITEDNPAPLQPDSSSADGA